MRFASIRAPRHPRWLAPPWLALVIACGSSGGAGLPDASSDAGLPDASPDTSAPPAAPTSPVVDTMQSFCFDESGDEVVCPTTGASMFGQDAQYVGHAAAYEDLGDGTVRDLVTGLEWQQTPDFVRYAFADADEVCDGLALGGHDDWRLPSIRELYSLADFRGGLVGWDVAGSVPYLDTDYFDFEYDAEAYRGQFWSSTPYVTGPIDGTRQGAFGFNFADGHIKAYPTGGLFTDPSVTAGFRADCLVRCVRGAPYGDNAFRDLGDGTIADDATGLVWERADDGTTRDWPGALAYCEGLALAGHDDWRLPDAKELQSLVDYEATSFPAIDPLFVTTDDQAWFWTSTTHGDNTQHAVYVAFGPAWAVPVMGGGTELVDFHGAGAQRADPKVGDPADYDLSSENAADEVRIDNYVRCVRGGATFDPDAGGDGRTDGNTGGPGGGGSPPAEAIAACDGLAAGAACAIDTPEGTVRGSCADLAGVTACVPEGGPPGSA